MNGGIYKKLTVFAVFFAAAWLGARYLLPIVAPFIVGFILALAAEPVVDLGVRKLRLPRTLSVGIGVSLTLILLTGLLWFLASLLVRELGELADALPDMENTAQEGIQTAKIWLTDMASRSPKGVRPLLTGSVQRLFDGEQNMLGSASQKAIDTVKAVLTRIPNSALGLGAALISAFMISRRLPDLKNEFRKMTQNTFGEKIIPAAKTARRVVGRWLLAQLKLSGITCGIVAVGLLLLRVPYAPLLALGIAFVDALPVLGTGIILLPWAGISLLQDNHLLAIGLVCIYGAAAITRTVMEPRLVGNQLGLDPLLTLIFLYAGFRLWGVPGMLFTPILAAVVRCVLQEFYRQKRQK